jgi:hypothetical protein
MRDLGVVVAAPGDWGLGDINWTFSLVCSPVGVKVTLTPPCVFHS